MERKENDRLYKNYPYKFWIRIKTIYYTKRISKEERNMPHFKTFGIINLQYEISIWQKILNKATNDKN